MSGPRSDEEQPPAPFAPSESWIDAFESQCTESTMKRVKRYVAYRLKGLGTDGIAEDAYYANELVQNAVTDTVLGVLRWDPALRTLELHLRDAARLRIRRDLAHARRFPHASIDDFTADGESQALTDAEASLLAAVPEEPAELAARATETIAALRAIAQDDPPVLALLDAFAGGATSKPDAMRVAKLSATAYRSARRRLARVVAQLPPHLQSRTILPTQGD